MSAAAAAAPAREAAVIRPARKKPRFGVLGWVTVAVVLVTLIAVNGMLVLARRGWAPVRIADPTIEDGNERYGRREYAGALERYTAALRGLPDDPVAHLDRGLALARTNKLAEARQELLRVSDAAWQARENAEDREVRRGLDLVESEAFFASGNTFLTEALEFMRHQAEQAQAANPGGLNQGGAQQPQQPDHQGSQRILRDAIEQYKRALRKRPGWLDAAWNLELALRLLQQEQQRQQEQQQEQQQQQQDQNQQGQNDQNQQSQPQQQDSSSDQQDQQQNQQDQQDQNPQQDQQQQNPQRDQADQRPEGDQQQGQQQQPDAQRGGPSDRREPGGADDRQGGDSETQVPNEQVPDEVARILDSIQQSEESVERARARARAAQQPRRPTKDW